MNDNIHTSVILNNQVGSINKPKLKMKKKKVKRNGKVQKSMFSGNRSPIRIGNDTKRNISV
jgi:hypothetical protein